MIFVEMQVLAEDRNKNVAGLNRLMGSQAGTLTQMLSCSPHNKR